MKLRKIVLTAAATILPIASIASAKTISNYKDLVNTLQNGLTVNAIIDVNKCKYLNGKTNEWHETQRGVRIKDLYERVAPDLSSGKEMHLIAAVDHDYNGSTDMNSLVIIRTLLRVFENNTVELIDTEFDPQTGARKDFTAMVCQLSNDGGASLVTHN